MVGSHGQILTNEHVIKDAVEIHIEHTDLTRYPVKLVFADAKLDLALLQITQPSAEMSALSFRSEDPRPGEEVMAVGQPFGLGGTVTVGVISGLHRNYSDLGSPTRLDPYGIWSFIQTDASINIGNSGGPLVDREGKVVGITTAMRRDGQGLAFAIPAPIAQRFLDEIERYGHFRHSYLGIAVENIRPEHSPLHRAAIRVTKVSADGPGERAQLQVGDLILSLDQRTIRRVSDLAYYSQLRGIGSEIEVEIFRGSRPIHSVILIPAQQPL